jgi:hypothetical protein
VVFSPDGHTLAPAATIRPYGCPARGSHVNHPNGPAVRVADRRYLLHLNVLTMTRSAYVQVIRCAVVALWSEHPPRYAHRIRPTSTNLDSILPTLSVLAG